MLTLYDYAPSCNAWKVRQLLAHLHRPYRTVPVAIFDGEGRTPAILALNPTGTVPIIVDDGVALAESNAILAYLADGTPYLPADAMARAQVHRWMSFEQERVESVIGALRHWTMTGKLARRAPDLVAAKRAAGDWALSIIDDALADRAFLVGDRYTIADIALYAYAGRAEDAGLDTRRFPRFDAWRERVTAQPGFVATMVPYAVDPSSSRELPIPVSPSQAH